MNIRSIKHALAAAGVALTIGMGVLLPAIMPSTVRVAAAGTTAPSTVRLATTIPSTVRPPTTLGGGNGVLPGTTLPPR